MDPITAVALINATMRLAGLAVASYPKVSAFIDRIKGDDKPITIEELDALIAQVESKNEGIQKA